MLKLSLFADYFQFYLQDEATDGDLSNAWTDEALADLIALAPGTIGVGTARNTDVPVVVELSEAEPPPDLEPWDQVIDCDIAVPSGTLAIAGCTDYLPDAARMKVPAGDYRARVFFGGLNTIGEDGLQGDDHYRVVLWRGQPAGLKVLKRDESRNKRAV